MSFVAVSRLLWLSGLLIASAAIALVLAAPAAEAKETALTFEKVVILEGGKLSEPVEITSQADLANSALDSVRPKIPPQDDLGTPYGLFLYAQGSGVTMEVTYYASRNGERGYIYRADPVYIGGGTLHPGWVRPSPALESTLRRYGAVNLADSGGSPATNWHVIAPATGVAAGVLLAVTFGWLLTRRRHVAEAA